MTAEPTSFEGRRARASRAGAVVLGLALGFALPRLAEGQAAELEGSWQIDIDCGLFSVEYATATQFLVIEEADDGSGLTSWVPQCPTLAVPRSIQEIQCVVPVPGPDIGVDGTSVWFPEDGPELSVSSPVEPFPFPLLGCSQVARIESGIDYHGRVVRDASGSIEAIRGELRSGPIRMWTPSGTLCFELLSTYPCGFEMRRNDLEPGLDVTVEPRPGARLTFAEVLTPGRASVVPLTELAADLPPGFRVVGDTVQVVFDVTTTSEFVGPVGLCVTYLDANDDGFVDGTAPPVPEENVRLLHEEDGLFIDRTTSLDPESNVVCSETDGLSQFALGDSPIDSEPPIVHEPAPRPIRSGRWRRGVPSRSPVRRGIGLGSRLPRR